MRVVFDHSEEEADNIYTFFFKPDKKFDYTAGQYIELALKHAKPDDRGIKRWFTLSSSPEDDYLTITTKLTPEKGSSFKRALANLESGHEATMTGPLGDFVLPKLIQTPLIFIAGGIGITPFHSILKWLIETGEKRPSKLIYAVKNEDEIIFQDIFDKANQHVTLIVEDPSPSWGGERGRLSSEMIIGLAAPTDDSLVYLSGPEPMVERLGRDLKRDGINQSQLVTDSFPNYLDF